MTGVQTCALPICGMNDYETGHVILRLAQTCGLSEEEAVIKVQSALAREAKKERNMQGDVREWVELSTGRKGRVVQSRLTWRGFFLSNQRFSATRP